MNDDAPITPEDLSRSYASLIEPPVAETPPDPVRIVEALLFVGGEPLTSERTEKIIRGFSSEQFHAAIDQLNEDYRKQGRPYLIQVHEQGYLLKLRPRYLNVLEQLYGGPKEARLSVSAIDVLALVAYRQPVAKAEVDSLRGAESGSLLRQLVRRGLIQVVLRGESGKKDVSYGTTPRFLELFGLDNLNDLPQTQELQLL